jgi:protein-tyrosine phosphatase
VTAEGARVLFVCTGNICRSPYLELRLRAALAAAGRNELETMSAGTGAVVGHGVSDRLAVRLRGLGIDPSAHRGSQLTRADIDRAALILTASREHRRIVTRIDPGAAGRAFTVRQFLRLLAAASPAPGADIDALVDAANGARGRAGASTDDDDIEDPWRRSRRVYTRAAVVMDEAIDDLVARLVR